MSRLRSQARPQFTPFQIAVHAASLIPLVWLTVDYFTNNLTVNPIQEATIRTGKYALIFLVLSLACTPLNSLFGFREALKVRRPLGLYAFLYAALHVTIFFAIDYGFDWALISEAVLTKPYIIVGLTAFTLLLLLAATSYQWWMKKLGKNWKRLHRLVYLAAVLVIIHYAWATKGEVLALQGDILQPLAFGLAVFLLLALRIPLVRRWTGSLRQRGKSQSQRQPATPVR